MTSLSASSPAIGAASVAGVYLQPLLEAAAARGVARAQLARAAGLVPESLDPLPGSLAAADYLRLLDAGAELACDPHFGLHVGECVKLGTYNVYGMILLSCRDFGQALQQTLRYEALAHELGHSALLVEDDVAEYRWHSAFPEASRHLAESVFAGIQVVGGWLAGRPLPTARLAFAHAAPDDCSEHLRIFGPDVRFGAPLHSARFDAALLAWPVRNADIGLHPLLKQHAEQLLSDKLHAREHGIVAEVRAVITRKLACDGVRLAQVAPELNLTPRTLQRKLNEAGIGYQQLLDQTRHALAENYLRQPHLSLAEIAFLLGYQEQSSFTHAFKDWAGVTPGGWREAQLWQRPDR
jgi:AraC-like DNA-binding protein